MRYNRQLPQRVEVKIVQNSCCFDLIRLLLDGKSPKEASAIIKEYYDIVLFPESITQFMQTDEYHQIANSVVEFDKVRLGELQVKWHIEAGGGMELPPMLLGHITELEEVRQDVEELHDLALQRRAEGDFQDKLEEQVRRLRVFSFDLRKEIHSRTAGSILASRGKNLVQEVAVLAVKSLGKYIEEETRGVAFDLFKSEILRVIDALEAEHAVTS